MPATLSIIGVARCSPDNAVTWVSIASPAASLLNVVFGAGIFIAYSPGSAASIQSPDGLAWSIGPAVPGGTLEVAFEAGRFQTRTSYSTNGQTWSALTGPAIPQANGESVRAGNGQFLTWGRSTSPPPFYTSTGGAWSGPYTAPVLDEISNAGFCGDLWIAVTGGTKLLTSPIPSKPAPVPPPLTATSAVRLTWPSEAGRTYLIQSSSNNATWSDASGLIVGDGTTQNWTAPASAGRQFFRVLVR